LSTAIELLRQGKTEELWQMCCGYLKLDINQFMEVQKRLLEEQLELLNNSELGKKIMKGAQPRTLEEFREQVPLTNYEDYLPELEEKREDLLPVKPEFWIHSSGKTGEYACKWVPITTEYSRELSQVLYGVGLLSCCNHWGDTSRIPDNIKILYSVARRPYVSGAFADILRQQTPLKYMPGLEESEELSFEERIRLGFKQAMSEGLDYFFGLSLVLASVGEKFKESSGKIDILPYLTKPRSLVRLVKGFIKSKIAKRQLLPKDLWTLKGIISSGLDSFVYKDKIRESWGRNPLDIYSSTEGGVMATQTWDYDGMTFIPNLNLYEFIPEEEHLKWVMDQSYQLKTLLLDEVTPGENYEIVLTNFHGGALVRYRIGDMIKITSLDNEKTGVKLPQMVFERRVDDIIDFNVIRLSEKVIWQALEKAGISYEDWIAYREPGQLKLNLVLELKDNNAVIEKDITSSIYEQLIHPDSDEFAKSAVHHDLMDMVGFSLDIRLLPKGTFRKYMTQRQAEGADLAHLKPPHINPREKVLSSLLSDVEEITVISGSRHKIETGDAVKDDKIVV